MDTKSDDDLWGSSNKWSSAITGESARILGIPGYSHSGEPKAVELAHRYLGRINKSGRTSRRLYSGHPRSPATAVGDVVRLPLTALSPDKDFARTFATGANATLLVFEPGIAAMKYTDIEWITAGDFIVRRIVRSKDPYWGTALTQVVLGQGAALRRRR